MSYRPIAGLAIALLVTGIQAVALVWLVADGQRTTATVLDSRRRPQNDIELDVNCTRGMTCVLVAFEGDERRIETWVGRGVPQGMLRSPYRRGEQVEIVYRRCGPCILHLGNDYFVKLRTFDGMWASLVWCLALSGGLFLAAALLRRREGRG
jgi:hypothetical protein